MNNPSRNNRRGGRRGLPRRTNNRGANNRNLVHKNTINGVKNRPNPDPRPIQEVPWNSVTLEYAYESATPTAAQALSMTSVYNRIVGQLGVDVPTNKLFEVRFLNFRCWNLSGGVIEVFAADLLRPSESLVETQQLAISTVKDFPGRNRWATVGYTWPKSHQTYTFSCPVTSGSGQDYDLLVVNSEPSNNILIRVNILWRGTPSSSASKLLFTAPLCHAREMTLTTPEDPPIQPSNFDGGSDEVVSD